MIKVFDDLIPKQFVDEIYDRIFIHQKVPFTPNFPYWEVFGRQYAGMNFTSKIAYKIGNLKTDIENYNYFKRIVEIVCDEVGKELVDIPLIRAYIEPPKTCDFEHTYIHRDLPNMKHYVILYYVDDADGDTHIFDETPKVIQRVTPKKGRVLFFDGQYLHASGIPKKSIRSVINFAAILKQ